METEFIELSRYRNAERAAETIEFLKAAGIFCRVASTESNFDITAIGSGSNAETIISVTQADFPAARIAMEAEFLQIDLPDDHYLLTSSDEELIEILGASSEWSAFDVAHARRLANERGIDPHYVEMKRLERIEQLKRGKPASQPLLVAGWVFSILGGLGGIGIAWSLCFMKEKTPDGEYFSYDAESREIGKYMLLLASTVLLIVIILNLSAFLYS